MGSEPGVTPTGGQGGAGRAREAVVTGFVLRLAREAAPSGCSREQLAASLHVSVDTVSGWETGRRPLTAVRTDQLILTRHTLLGLGTPPSMLRWLDLALEADVIIDHALRVGTRHERGRPHPLGAWVLRGDVVNLVRWPLTLMAPPGLPLPTRSRRGPVADHPVIDPDARDVLFDHLRRGVDTAHPADEALLRRQALYLLAFDSRPDTRHWLADRQRAMITTLDGWGEAWSTGRSIAIPLARHGDHDALTAFIDQGLRDDRGQMANLNYWAYWLGEDDIVQRGDAFMPHDTGSWRGERTLTHLVAHLNPTSTSAELNVHSVWALLTARPRLLDDHRELTAELAGKVDVFLDNDTASPRGKRELEGIRYALRLHQR